MNDRPSLIPVMLAVLAFPLVLVPARLVLPLHPGAGILVHQLLGELALMIVTVAIVAWTRWWRQTGLVGPWRQRWWVLLLVGLLLEQLPFWINGPVVWGDPAQLPALLPLAGMIGFCEETLTRGVMLYGMSRFGPLVAGLVTAAIFGMLHAIGLLHGLPVSFVIVQMITAALVGLLFAGLRFRMILLWPMIVAHAAFDMPGLLEGYPVYVQPIGLLAALFSIWPLVPFGLAGLGLLLWDQLNGTDLRAVAGHAAGT